MFRFVSVAAVWWRASRAAAARCASRPDWALAADQLRARLAGHGLRAWRHRRSAIGTAWAVCLIGWAGGVLLPDGGAPLPAASAGLAPPAARPSPRAAIGDETVAALQADLDAALALRAAHARQLAGIPRLLDGRPNPIHQRRAIQLDQQDALIATLRRRRAELPAGAADLERHLHRLPDRATGLPAGAARPASGALPPAPAGRPTIARAPAEAPVTGGGASRLTALCGVLLLATAAGAAFAAWRGQRDGIIDHPCQLPPRATLPVLCTIELPTPRGQVQRERAGTHRAALAGLALLGLFASLVAADRLGTLAALRQGLLGGWPG